MRDASVGMKMSKHFFSSIDCSTRRAFSSALVCAGQLLAASIVFSVTKSLIYFMIPREKLFSLKYSSLFPVSSKAPAMAFACIISSWEIFSQKAACPGMFCEYRPYKRLILSSFSSKSLIIDFLGSAIILK